MSRRDGERLQDILDAIDAIRSHVARGGLSDGLVCDAVRVRFIDIGEAIKAISTEFLDTEPGHPWSDIARMRDRLAHRNFDTNHSHVSGAVEHDLGPLEAAVLRSRADSPSASSGPYRMRSHCLAVTAERTSRARGRSGHGCRSRGTRRRCPAAPMGSERHRIPNVLTAHLDRSSLPPRGRGHRR